ncbi:hypothetical protein C8R46DRAFT_1029308 [Mycena filopes]|nr:hypothetical protein C8R46DRAFT_1029308 [Mycena filopes]
MSTPAQYVVSSLSAGIPFLETLNSSASDDATLGTSAPAPEKTVGGEVSVHHQKGLSHADVAGLKGAQQSLAANSGGMFSGVQLPVQPRARRVLDADPGPAMGPASTNRTIARALTLPEGALARTDDPVIAPAATATAPAASDHSRESRSPSPDPDRLTTFAHFGMLSYSHPDNKLETSAPMAKRATQNIEIIADVVRATETAVADLTLDLGKLTVELRLGEHASAPAHQSHSPPPTQDSVADDVDELFHRSKELRRADFDLAARITVLENSDLEARITTLEGTASMSLATGVDADLTARVSALEDRAVLSDALTTTALSTAIARRFGEITSDRDQLDLTIRKNFEDQLKVNATLRLENKDLRKTLELIQNTLVRLELEGATAPRHAPRERITSTSVVRNHSPTPDLPSKRQKGPVPEAYITVGPIAASPLPPLELFESIISALPTFLFTKPFQVVLDPVHAYHLRVAFNSAQDMTSLLVKWNTGKRDMGMVQSDGDGVDFSPRSDSISGVRTQHPRITQNHAFARGGSRGGSSRGALGHRTAVRQFAGDWWTPGIFTWEGRTPPVQERIELMVRSRWVLTGGPATQTASQSPAHQARPTPWNGVCSVGIWRFYVSITTRTLPPVCLR